MLLQTREELVNALMDAAELEHNLACLYLFAAFTIKEQDEIGNEIPQAQVGAVAGKLDDWRDTISQIAIQEMGHLGTVSNLLTLLGAEAHFDRPNFPPQDGYYPPTAEFKLEPFGHRSLQRFVEFERNQNQPGVEAFGLAPRSIVYQHVGELYAAIFQAFAETTDNPPGTPISDSDLFSGYQKAVDQSWNSAVEVHSFGLADSPPTPVNQLRSRIRAALQDVIEEGEGSPTQAAQSHYQQFFRIEQERAQLALQFPQFNPARNVATNPMTQFHRGAKQHPHVTRITDPLTKDVAELFNACYGTLVLVLRQYYSFAEDLTEGNRRVNMAAVATRLMKVMIKPLGRLLTRMPIASPPSGFNAGPGFELYRPLYISTDRKIAWTTIRERFTLARDEATRLQGAAQVPAEVSALMQRIVNASNQVITLITNGLI